MTSSEKNREILVTNATKEKVEAAKNFIEQRYSKLLQQEHEKKKYWEQLNRKMQMLGVTAAEQ
jgi:serine/threonine kinase 38